MKKVLILGLTLLTASSVLPTRQEIQGERLQESLLDISDEFSSEENSLNTTPESIDIESQKQPKKGCFKGYTSAIGNRWTQTKNSIKNKWRNWSFTGRETVEASTLLGLTTLMGYVWGGNIPSFTVPFLANTCATISAGNISEMLTNQHISLKFFKTLIPAIAAFCADYYGLLGEAGLNPYPFNMFFLAMCFCVMHELKIASGRLPVKSETLLKSIFVRKFQEINQRVRETAELAVLAGTATALGAAEDAATEAGLGTHEFVPLAFAGMAGANVADMLKKRPYWQQSLALLPTAAIAELINHFTLEDARPEVAYILFFGWLTSSLDQIKKIFTKKKNVDEHSEAPTEVGARVVTAPARF